MPKGHRSVRSQGYYRLSPVTSPTTANYPPISARPSSLQQNYYSQMPTNMTHQQSYQTQQPQAHYATGGPVQHPMTSHNAYNIPLQQHPTHQAPAPLSSIRPSSGAWNPQDDQTLMAARAQGMNWAPIQQAYFPTKTPNACRKRHERLMERRSADDWDGMKLENLAKNYMGMRREIWSGLANATGEKWNVVEQKCMSQGLKNLQTSARSCARRERMLDTSSHATGGSMDDGTYGGVDDSGIDLEAEYDADGASEHSGGSNGYGGYSNGHQRIASGGSSGSGNSGRWYGDGQGSGQASRLPSMDMGIDAIINRPGGGR